jgi:hypothetical protein
MPAHLTNTTVNSFDLGMRTTVNGTTGIILSVSITPNLVNTMLWFYSQVTCVGGGIGVINVNNRSWPTLWGFHCNTVCLDGTAPTSSRSALHPTGTSGCLGASQSSNSSDTPHAATNLRARSAPFAARRDVHKAHHMLNVAAAVAETELEPSPADGMQVRDFVWLALNGTEQARNDTENTLNGEAVDGDSNNEDEDVLLLRARAPL